MRIPGTLLLLALVLHGCGSAPDPLSAGPEGVWLRGDLHVHSDHSDDAEDNPMDVIVAKAESLGFDYFVVTDHDNHVDGMLTTWSDPAYRSETMSVLYGVEWTTGLGHANVFGAEPFDHAPLWALREGDGAEVVAAAHAQGLHFSINHPVAKDLWEYGYDIGADSIEVWNSMYKFPNDSAIAIAEWDARLSNGVRITARGGSDCHHQEEFESMLFNMGNPTTWVFARDRSNQAILDALGAGHVVIGYAPSAERIDFRADADGDRRFETIVGDNLPMPTGASVAFRVEIVGFRRDAPYTLRVLKNGAIFSEAPLTRAVYTFEDAPAAGERAHYRVELRGDTPEAPPFGDSLYEGFIGMTNPIHFGFL